MPLQSISAIPSTAEILPRVGLGTWQTFDVGTDASRRATLTETLKAFFDGGGKVIDTSPMYGTSEAVLGDLLAAGQLHAKAFLATKVWTTGEKAGVDQMAASYRLLKAQKVDLMQIHNLVDWRTHLKTLRKMKDDGRVKHIGITHYERGSHDDVARVLRAEPLDFVQLNLSLAEPEAADRMLALCEERRVAFIANRPFGGGGALSRVLGKPLPPWAADYDIKSWAQFMLKWILSHPQVTIAIPGTGNPDHMRDNLAGGRGRIPDAAARGRMAAYWRAI
jgi:diketogulonate reductase-like aldo/keto reductase